MLKVGDVVQTDDSEAPVQVVSIDMDAMIATCKRHGTAEREQGTFSIKLMNSQESDQDWNEFNQILSDRYNQQAVGGSEFETLAVERKGKDSAVVYVGKGKVKAVGKTPLITFDHQDGLYEVTLRRNFEQKTEEPTNRFYRSKGALDWIEKVIVAV
ncbi:hypothetical protein CA51_11450 [Rosistilla oblonga]|uniref:hypothetical protein n=1 Tax=Rosistilla oblonga TaxID=2527990 RepID=UPI001188C00F|nr:hypothetical protein [Rosistilla oblonga]QDV11283.1 hypothetical protein CA51_11450 [Rosistilla oblonga]